MIVKAVMANVKAAAIIVVMAVTIAVEATAIVKAVVTMHKVVATNAAKAVMAIVVATTAIVNKVVTNVSLVAMVLKVANMVVPATAMATMAAVMVTVVATTAIANNRGSQGGFNRGGYNKFSNPGKRRIEYKEEAFDPTKPIRLNKFLANAGVCSRRDADKYIEAGVVKVNGEVITELGHKVLRTDTILFHDQQVKAEKKIYVLLNKPKGYVTTSEDPQNRKTVMDLVRNACMERIYPVGRLDRNTTGVLLLTNDGEMASKLTHPKFLKKKIYHVYLDRNVTAADLRQIAEGITLEDGDIRADAVDYASETDKKQVGIEIHSGKNRIVRRIFASLGYNVVKLDRVYFAGLTKKNVKRGDWRFLTEEEVRMLRMGSFE